MDNEIAIRNSAQDLIVDDEEAVRNVMRHYSQNSGYNVYTAANGVETLKLCEEVQFDVILLDIYMPEMDGLETLRYMRNRFP